MVIKKHNFGLLKKIILFTNRPSNDLFFRIFFCLESSKLDVGSNKIVSVILQPINDKMYPNVECILSWVDLVMCRIVELSKYYIIFIYFQAAVSALLAVSVL